MNILIFVKQVPETDDVKLDPQTGNLQREGVKSIMNPNDANVIEAALQLKEKHGGRISVVTMGPSQALEVQKKALGMGCDEAFLLSDRQFGGADTLATSYTLAKAAEKIGGYDLLILGRLASDGDTAQTGPAVAAQLGIPQITFASSIEVEDGWVYCDRDLGDKVQRVRAKLPAAVILNGGVNKPRYASPINIMRAQKKPRAVWGAGDLDCDARKIGIPGSPSETKKVFEPDRCFTDTTFLSGSVEDMAKSLADMLEAEHII